MKQKTLFFNFLVAILFTACQPSKKLTTPTEAIKTEPPAMGTADSFLSGLLRQSPILDSIVKNKEAYRVQVIYTQIDRNAANKPSFTHHYLNVNPAEYYYPASTVKLPAAILALQKLNELDREGLDKYTTMITEAAAPGQTAVYNDPTSPDGRPTIAQYIRKILLVSDNDAFNRLYEFLGQEYLNKNLHKMGYNSAQIVHRLGIVLTEEQNRTTNPVKFYAADNKMIYEQPLTKSNWSYQQQNVKLGNGYLTGDQLVQEPFDFSKKNKLSLPDLHSIVQSVLFPEAVSRAQRFRLKPDDYFLLQRYMSMKPGESSSPEYDSSHADAQVKFLMYGGEGKMDNSSIRIFNKVGNAYGFLTDAAYVVDFDKGVEFMLSATIYCNADGIFNDDRYDYKTIGYPFMKELGQVIYNYELKRTKKNIPDLSAFKFSYEK